MLSSIFPKGSLLGTAVVTGGDTLFRILRGTISLFPAQLQKGSRCLLSRHADRSRVSPPPVGSGLALPPHRPPTVSAGGWNQHLAAHMHHGAAKLPSSHPAGPRWGGTRTHPARLALPLWTRVAKEKARRMRNSKHQATTAGRGQR